MELDGLQDARAEARQDYAAANRGRRPDDVLDAIVAESVLIGMTHDELLLVVTYASIRRTATAEGVGEVWEIADLRLTLRDAKLVAWSAPGTDPSLSRALKIPQPVVPGNDAY